MFRNGSSTIVLAFIYDESGSPVATAALSSHGGACSPIALLLPLARLSWLCHWQRSARSPYAMNFSPNNGITVMTFYYVLNLQGDVVALMQVVEDANGNLTYYKTANYTYNAWGELVSITDNSGNPITSAIHVGALNPLRYRGYYYDSETGFYYLQSRYYDPVTHRFINADGYASTGQGFIGTNMFAYCNNSPLTYSDSSGNYCTYSVQETDSGGYNPIYVKGNKEYYDIVTSMVTLVPPAAEGVSVEVTYGSYERSKSQAFLDEKETDAWSAFMTFGLGWVLGEASDIIGSIIGVYSDYNEANEPNITAGIYESYTVVMEYWMTNIVTSDRIYHYEERIYIVAYQSNGTPFLYLAESYTRP